MSRDILEAASPMNNRGPSPVCGAISQYDGVRRRTARAVSRPDRRKRLSMQAFIVMDYMTSATRP